MSRAGDLMRKSLKKHVIPRLHALGFDGSRSSFRRAAGQKLDLLEFHYWKYGGALIVEFARTERGDFSTSWGTVVPESQLTVAHISPLKRARLKSSIAGGKIPPGWFRFEHFGEDMERYDALAAELAALLPQADAWLREGRVGDRVAPFDTSGRGAVA
jgi:hypothetical protein